MKKIIALMLIALFCMALAACGDGEPKRRTAETSAPAMTEAATEAATEAPTEEATEAPTEAPTEEPAYTVTDYLNSEEGKQAAADFKSGAEVSGTLTADCYAEGDNILVFDASFTVDIPAENLEATKTALQEYLDKESSEETFESANAELEDLGVKDPKCKVIYRNSDGTILVEKIYG